LKNKQFVYRAKELERLGEFVSNIKKRYPGAEQLHEIPIELSKTAQCLLSLFVVLFVFF
jgi:hypothetical protein